MCIAVVSGKNRHQQGTKDITLGRSIGAGIRQGTGGNKVVIQPADLEEGNEKGQLPQRRDRRLGIPFHMDLAGVGVDSDSPIGWNHQLVSLTHLVNTSVDTWMKFISLPKKVHENKLSSTAVFRFIRTGDEMSGQSQFFYIRSLTLLLVLTTILLCHTISD